ncbi:YggT family protein [bacterium]|nr:YggT family protein [bacterium]
MDILKFLVAAFDIFSELMFYLIFIRVILSWIAVKNAFTQGVNDLTEPILAPFKKVFSSKMGLDFSPILAMLFLQALQYFIHAWTQIPYVKLLF